MDVPLSTILDSIEDAILAIDDSSHVAFLNDAAGRLLGCQPASCAGQPLCAVPSVAALVAELDLDFSAHSNAPARLVRHLPRTAPAVPLDAVVTHVWLDSRRLFTIVLRDAGGRIEAERAVYEARKTQALGALAGGIAHDFNNLLAAVISQIDLALYAPGFPPALRENLAQAQTSARRGAELVGKLQAFSGRNKPELGPVNPRELVEQVAFVLRRSVDPRISVQTPNPVDAPWEILADANQVMQALLNLGINARDALNGTGTLALTSVNVTISPVAAIAPRRAGEFVRFTITHSAEAAPGLAHGVGLSIARALAAEQSGWIESGPDVPQGSATSMFLPRHAAAVAAPKPAIKVETSATEGRERILVVDDEEMVRMVIKAVLAYRGYQVTEARDGEEAVQLYSANPGGFDLVVLDLHMPRLSGHEALLRIRAVNPNARAVMLSGGIHDLDTTSGLDPIAFLQKPFENQELLQLIREMLDAR